jgi:hypothetical protein
VRRVVGLGLCAVLSVAAYAAEKKPVPWVQVPLDSLGFPGVSSAFLGSGSSVLTVNFLDNSHLLVTYEMRKLVPRLDRDPEDHEDRLVAGVVVDLPSGHVADRTEWHMHDHGRYLWALGNGRFLLRIGDGLSTMAPLKGLAAGNAFARTSFPGRQARPSLVEVSPDGGVVTMETVVEAAPKGERKVLLGDADTAQVPTSRAVIDFFRVKEDDGPTGFVLAKAGTVLAQSLFLLAVDADGYLWAEDEGSGVWGVTFDGFEGKTIDLGKIQSSCRPRLQMTSRSEFLAMTCQGADDRIKLTSYGLDGVETWEESVGNTGSPSFAFAPVAARFAVSGSDSSAVVPAGVAGQPEEGPRQEVRVYQNASGDLLLRVECTPAFKTAENFDLSGDGMLAAVVRNGAIAVYKLPPLSKRDKDDMAEVGAFAPPASVADVSLKRLQMPARAMQAMRRAEAQSAMASGPGAVQENAVDMGSSAAASPRRPPTLLKPGEKPEFGTGNAAPE